MKKTLAFLMAASCAVSLFGCTSAESSSSAAETTTAAQTTAPIETTTVQTEATTAAILEAVEAATKKTNGDDFDVYISNTPVATGNNFVLNKKTEVSYRAYFPVEESGKLDYCFYFSNSVDSTYDQGKQAHPMEGGTYTILSASVSDGGTGPNDPISNTVPVKFGGSESKEVAPGECFWSDPVVGFDVPEGHYLVWEWKLSGENIPCTNMSSLTSSTSDQGKSGGKFTYCDQIPLPQLIGAKRDVKYTISAIGDSITQGCQTTFMEYEFWAAQISRRLGDDYGFWNCGLGWSRTSDAATCGDWLERTKKSDIVLVAFGTNDIYSGEYNGDGGNTATEIDAYLRTVLDELSAAGCTMIVFNAPPENFGEPFESVRVEYNENLRATCAEYGAYYFDFAGLLCEEATPSQALFGAHPNGEGGTVVTDSFVEKFAKLLDLA